MLASKTKIAIPETSIIDSGKNQNWNAILL